MSMGLVVVATGLIDDGLVATFLAGVFLAAEATGAGATATGAVSVTTEVDVVAVAFSASGADDSVVFTSAESPATTLPTET